MRDSKPKMSSDIDEEEDYSSIDERDPKMSPPQREQQQQQLLLQQQLVQQQQQRVNGSEPSCMSNPAYVNLNDKSNNSHKLVLDLNGGETRSMSRRDKTRYSSQGRSYRKSRSRERNGEQAQKGNGVPSPPNLSSPINPGSLNFVGVDPDRIRERERELEKIHRRSRELMLSPRIVEARSRESSSDRMSSSRVSNTQQEGWKPVQQNQPPPPPPPPLPAHQHHPPPPAAPPPPLPPRIHSPPAMNNGFNNRYKCSSPAVSHPVGQHLHHHHHQRLQNNPASLRRRVQSPNRRDFKDFSQQPRDFRSPMRIPPRGSYFDEDDDSGADSLDQQLQQACCSRRLYPHQQQSFPVGSPMSSSSSMALVPYEQSVGCCSTPRHHHLGCQHHPYQTDWCCPMGSETMSTSTALQTLPGVEERLLQLEGDKDSLHLQVALLSDQLELQTEKLSDLEKILDDKKETLKKTEDHLQREMLSRSSLETKKLELLSEISSMKLKQAKLERENLELRKRLQEDEEGAREEENGTVQRQPVSRGTVDPAVMALPPSGAKSGNALICTPRSHSSSDPRHRRSGGYHSGDELTLQTFGTMPRRGRSTSNKRRSKELRREPLETHFNDETSWSNTLNNNHSGSAPSLVPNDGSVALNTLPRAARHQSVERVLVTQYSIPPSGTSSQQHPIATKPKGLKRILGRMRRSNSGTIHEDKKKGEEAFAVAAKLADGLARNAEQPLKRGGFRASAGSRFAAWMGPVASSPQRQSPPSYPDPNLPFHQWKMETICAWLDNLGLYMYNSEVRKHIKTGENLLAMSSHDLETKLGIRNGLHRKKVLLALQVKQEPGVHSDLPGRLDHQWVVRWLDDVGLPQYKDAFLEARVDGRVLNLLTTEDLFQLRVTNLLHHLSIRRGIQVLRVHDFEPACLRRRASPEERDRDSLPPEVATWTNHRVMEWLRHVDLAEYAPNLRGSGVHGGLLVHESRFSADLFASLLSIPPAKTLLRRHLSLHFRDLVGPDVMKEKRNAEEEPGHQALTPTAKVRPGSGTSQTRIGQFSLRRRRFKAGDELDFEELVCPLEQPEDK